MTSTDRLCERLAELEQNADDDEPDSLAEAIKRVKESDT